MSGKPFFSRLIIPLVGLFLCGAAVWASFAEIDEITRGEGKVIPATKTQTIQATEAGVVEEIFVTLGQIVAQGDLIVRLDDTSTSASLGESVARRRALIARLARLSLEESGEYTAEYTCPEEILAVAPRICENEENLYQSKRDNFFNRAKVLEQRELQKVIERKELDATTTELPTILLSSIS